MAEPYEIFVGRNREQEAFREMLSAQEGPWILNVWGDGGIGKTRLIERYVKICDEEGLQRTDIVDFYHTVNRTKVGLIASIASQLGSQYFPDLDGAIEEYYRATREEEAESALEKAIISFVKSYAQLPRDKRVVLFFDTFEAVKGTDVADWFLLDLLPQVKENVLVVIAGREKVDLPDIASEVGLLLLETFSLNETEDYLTEAGISESLPDEETIKIEGKEIIVKKEEVVGRVHSLSNGRPLLVALAADWINEWAFLPELAQVSAETFERDVIRKILDLQRPEDQAILRMAHAYHRFDKEVLAWLMEDLENPEEVITNLARFSFVKYRKESGSCLLHDEMQVLVNKHIWEEIDRPPKDTRKDVSKKMIGYYDQKIEAEEEKTGRERDERELQALRAERLYHLLYSDLEKGRPEFFEELDEAWHKYLIDYMDVLLTMGTDVNRALGHDDELGDELLDWLVKVARMWMLHEQWRPEEAQSLARELYEHPRTTQRIKATATALLGFCADRWGDHEQAVDRYQESLGMYNKMYEELKKGNPLPEEKGIVTVENIRPELHMLYNALGVTYRWQGRFEKAREWYDRAYESSKEAGDIEWMSAALNNIGNVLRFQGKMWEALQFCSLALTQRKQLGYLRDIALSHNTIGMVHRDHGNLTKAIHSFETAREMFAEMGDQAGLARANRNLGWVYYLQGKYDEAIGFYEKSVEICEKHELEPELPNVRNKLGIVYAAQGEWEEAKSYYEESLQKARELTDRVMIANDLVRLCELFYQTDQLDQIPPYENEIRQFEEDDFGFEPVYGDLEIVLGHIAYDKGEYEEAFKHYGKGFTYLAQHERYRFQERVEQALPDRLRRLPSEWKQKAIEALRAVWVEEGLDENYPHFIPLCEGYIFETATVSEKERS